MFKKLFFIFAAVILFLTLFPFGWLGKLWPAFDDVLTWAFPEPWGHFFGHWTLFTLVGFAALLILPPLRNRLWLYLPLVMLVGVGQEFFQLLYKQRPLELNDVIDLIPDYLGVLLAFGLMKLAQIAQTRWAESARSVSRTPDL